MRLKSVFNIRPPVDLSTQWRKYMRGWSSPWVESVCLSKRTRRAVMLLLLFLLLVSGFFGFVLTQI